jgi:hypothetical protein
MNNEIQTLAKSKTKSSPETIIENGLPKNPCFISGTLVHTNYGTTDIDFLEVGSLVLSRSETTGEQCYRRVTKTFVHGLTELYYVTYVTDDGETDTLGTIAEHPFWVKDVGWTEVQCLKEGQLLEICDPDGREEYLRPTGHQQELALSGGRWSATVVGVIKPGRQSMIYNI